MNDKVFKAFAYEVNVISKTSKMEEKEWTIRFIPIIVIKLFESNLKIRKQLNIKVINKKRNKENKISFLLFKVL